VAPQIVKYTDLEDLLALDPVHDVIAMTDEQRYRELERAFESAARSSEVRNYYVSIGGHNVKLCFAGNTLCDLLTPAIEHLRIEPARVDLSLFVADSDSTGVSPHVDPESFGDDLIPNATRPSAIRCTYVPTSEMYCCLHPERACGFLWVRSHTTLQHWDISAPFRPLLGWWAESLGAQLAHGAVVGTRDVGILLGGESGVGKSTLTLACLQYGLVALGDDYVWVEPGEPAHAFSLYCTAKVAPRDLQSHFADLAAYAHHMEGDKTCLKLSGVPGMCLTLRLPLRAIAALRISGKRVPHIYPGSAIEVLNSVGPSSLRQLSGSTLNGLHRLGQIIGRSRLVVFDASTDYFANARAVANLLSELAGHGGELIRSMSVGSEHCDPGMRRSPSE
jgi:hypothetical protein